MEVGEEGTVRGGGVDGEGRVSQGGSEKEERVK